MNLSKVGSIVLVSLSLLLAGCGGGGGGNDDPGSFASRLQFEPTGGYNGSTAALTAGNATTTLSGPNTVATVTQGNRTLRVELPTVTLEGGQTFAIGGENGAVVTYTEVRDRETIEFVWRGHSGTVTIEVTGPGTAEIEVVSGNFQADLSIEGNPATGAFNLTGNVAGIPVAGSGNIGGTANLTFSQVENVNADTSSMNGGSVAYVVVDSYGVLTLKTGTSEDGRLLTFTLGSTATAGTEFTLSGTLNQKGFVSFTERVANITRVWVATGGTLRVLARTPTSVRVELVNATFAKSPGTINSATGTFTLNGTIEAD